MPLTIGFIGTGVMGASMAGHLLSRGVRLKVYNRSPQKAQNLVKLGAKLCASVSEAARDADVVISMVGFPHDVEEVWMAQNGALSVMRIGAVGIDMTTSSPSLAKKLYEAAAEKGVSMLDAPVTGGDIGAREGKLTVMVGGDESVFSRMEKLLSVFAKKVVYFGEAGSGQYAKMCNQLAIAPTMLGLCEALVMADKSGLDPELVLNTISTGAVGSFSMTTYGPRILMGDYEPGFYIKHFVKDLKIALDSATELKLELPGLKLALKMYEQMIELGFGDSGTQAIFKLYEY